LKDIIIVSLNGGFFFLLLLREFSLTLDPLLTDVTEERDQVPSPESPVTEEVQEQTLVAAPTQVEEVAIASETNIISNSNGQIEGSSEGLNLYMYFNFYM